MQYYNTPICCLPPYSTLLFLTPLHCAGPICYAPTHRRYPMSVFVSPRKGNPVPARLIQLGILVPSPHPIAIAINHVHPLQSNRQLPFQ